MSKGTIADIERMITNREYEGMHPVRRNSAGLQGLAKAVTLAEGLDVNQAEQALGWLMALASKVTCTKCKCKVLLFGRELARNIGSDRADKLDTHAKSLHGHPVFPKDVDYADVELEVLTVLQAVRENPGYEIVA